MVPRIINQLMGFSRSSCSSKISVFLFLNQLSCSSRVPALVSHRSWVYPSSLCSSIYSYHASPNHTENAESSVRETSFLVNSKTDWNDPKITHNPAPRDSTPIGKQFESWVRRLQPGFTPEDVEDVLKQQSDPDLALDIFHWTAQQRNYKHNHQTYEIMIKKLASGKRYKQMDRLMEEVMAGACTGSVSLFNTMIYNYCQTKMLGQAINVYKRMQKVPNCKPTLRTYNTLLNALVSKFTSFTICCVYLRNVRSLYKQMNTAGVAPDNFAFSLLIKAYSRALEMDEAVKLFREMSLYGCSPNGFTFNYIIRGLCEKGRIKNALEYYDDMLRRGYVPSQGVYNVLICSLSAGGRLQEATKILLEMTDKGLAPDFLTYRTLKDQFCKAGKEQEAFELLHALREKGCCLDETTYRRLVRS